MSGDSVEVNNVDSMLFNVSIKGHTVPMQIDVGASVSVISSRICNDIGKPKLKKCEKKCRL